MRLTRIRIFNHGIIKNCDIEIVTPSGIILFSGKGGSGKTTLASAIAEGLIDKKTMGDGVIWGSSHEDSDMESYTSEIRIDGTHKDSEVMYLNTSIFKKNSKRGYYCRDKQFTVIPPRAEISEHEEYMWNNLLVIDSSTFWYACKKTASGRIPSVIEKMDCTFLMEQYSKLEKRMIEDLQIDVSDIGVEDLQKIINEKNKTDRYFKNELAYLYALHEKTTKTIEHLSKHEISSVETHFWKIMNKISAKSEWGDRFTMMEVVSNRLSLSLAQHIIGYLAFVFAYRDYLCEEFDLTPTPVVIDDLLDMCGKETERMLDYLATRPEQVFCFIRSCTQVSPKYETYNLVRIGDFETVVEKTH